MMNISTTSEQIQMRWVMRWDMRCRATRCFPRQVHVSLYLGRNNWMLWTCCMCTLATTTHNHQQQQQQQQPELCRPIRHCRSCVFVPLLSLFSKVDCHRFVLLCRSNDNLREYLWATWWSGDYWRRFDCRPSVQTGDKVEFDSLLRSKLNKFNSLDCVEFDKIGRVEFDFIASVYRALHCAVLEFSRAEHANYVMMESAEHFSATTCFH